MKVALCSLLLCASAAFADVPDGGSEELGTGDLAGLLDTPVVSGPSRAEERVDDSPATVTVVTSAQLRSLGLRTLHEAINFLSMGMVAQDPLHAVEVGARGVLLSGDYGNHFLVVVDGHTLNESWNGTAYYEQGLAMPIELIDHLELVVGPGSVLYGSSAMLGVVNVVTRRAAEIGLMRVTLEGALLPAQRADGSLSFAPEGFGGTGRVSLLSGWSTELLGLPFEVTAAGEYFMHQGQTLEFGKQTGLVEGDGTSEWPQRWTASGPAGEWGGETRRYATRTTSLWLKSRWGDVTGFARAASYSRNTPAIDGFGVAVDFDGRAYERDRSFDLELRWARVLNPHFSMMVRGYFDDYEYLGAQQSSTFLTNGTGELPEGADPANFSFLLETRGRATWGGLEAQATIDWLGDGRFPLMLGVDGRARAFGATNVDATLDGQILAESNAYEALEWQVAAYAQQRARLLPSLLLNAGVRVDTQSGFAPNVAPRGAVTWTAPWEGRFKVVVSSAFRSPSGYERFAQYEGFQVRNPLLTPERVLTGELGYEQRLGRHRFALVGFASRFTSLIRLEALPEDPPLTAYQNTGGLLNHGVQGLVEGTFGALSYGATFTGAFTTADDGTELLASPMWFGNARVTYTLWDDGPRASVLAHVSGPRLTTAAANQGVDADGNVLRWSDAARFSSPQIELRAVMEGKVKAVRGLWLRGMVGGNVMPYSVYAVGPLQAPGLDFTAPTLAPNNRLFVMLSVGWTLE
ncbi:MAG: TonB-dependent receptor [Archangium sp.]|nr:TonB-dependent receptor [Archangium sp.]